MTNDIGYIRGFKPKPFSLPSFCQSGGGLEEHNTYHYRKGHRQITGKPCYTPEQLPAADGCLKRGEEASHAPQQRGHPAHRYYISEVTAISHKDCRYVPFARGDRG